MLSVIHGGERVIMNFILFFYFFYFLFFHLAYNSAKCLVLLYLEDQLLNLDKRMLEFLAN